MYWVVPRFTPPWVKFRLGSNTGDAIVFWIMDLPLGSFFATGSKVRLPFEIPYTILMGMMKTGIVVVTFVLVGFVPTMVNVMGEWVRSVNFPVHCVR